MDHNETLPVTKSHTKLLKKILPTRRQAVLAATHTVAVGAGVVIGKVLKDRFNVDIEIEQTTVEA